MTSHIAAEYKQKEREEKLLKERLEQEREKAL